MRTAVYPGSFDPVTYGHLDVIKRSAAIFDKLIVAVSINAQKKPMFTLEERVEFIKEEVKGYNNVEVHLLDGLLVEYAKKGNASVIIKGLRAVSDFEYEFQMAQMNKKICPDIETLFMMTGQEYSYLSSSIVKEVARFGGKIDSLVPERVAKAVIEKVNLK
ncbi:MAG: pantetheine-phosphate adenylyltransferase [Clostridia bacterium]|nr:pantetheine-phosphate adenylyltransferase [Clostridia bacterium]